MTVVGDSNRYCPGKGPGLPRSVNGRMGETIMGIGVREWIWPWQMGQAKKDIAEALDIISDLAEKVEPVAETMQWLKSHARCQGERIDNVRDLLVERIRELDKQMDLQNQARSDLAHDVNANKEWVRQYNERKRIGTVSKINAAMSRDRTTTAARNKYRKMGTWGNLRVWLYRILKGVG